MILRIAGLKRWLLGILALSAIATASGFAVPYLFKEIIDQAMSPERQALPGWLWMLPATILFAAAASALRSYAISAFSLSLDVELSLRVVSQLFRLPLGFFHSHSTGDSMQRLRDLDRVRSFAVHQALESVLDILTFLGCLAVLMWHSPGLAVAYALLSAAFLALNRSLAAGINALYSEQVLKSGDAQTVLLGAIRSIATIKTYGAESWFSLRWLRPFQASAKLGRLLARKSSVLQFLIQAIFGMLPAAALVHGARMAEGGLVSWGTVVAWVAWVTLAFEPVQRLSGVMSEFQALRVGLDRVREILDAVPETDLSPAAEASQGKELIRISRASFRYPGESRWALRDVNFELHEGERVALMGPSGSGKSTLLSLMNRLWDAEDGLLLYRGVLLAEIPLEELRGKVALVAQAPELFEGTIAANVALGSETPRLDGVEKACRLAQADEFIRRLPGGYDYPLSEGGRGLSGGQRYRIAVARALYRDPELLLLDEPVEELITGLDQIAAGRSVVWVTHSETIAKRVGRIISIQR